MERSADNSPPPYFGDYPNGAYWSAIRPEGSVDDDAEAEDFTVEGYRLRIMWDEGAGPLWGDEGLLPDDPEWPRQSQALLNPRALQLAERLQTEVRSRFRVSFHP